MNETTLLDILLHYPTFGSQGILNID